MNNIDDGLQSQRIAEPEPRRQTRRFAAVRRAAAVLAICLVPLVGSGQTSAPAGPQTAPSAHRPAGVPSEFRVTPFGYYHPSCVHRLADGDVLHQYEKTVARANGTSESVAQCGYPHYRATGEKVIGDEPSAQEPSIGHSWVVSASITTKSSYAAIDAEWIVPPAPLNNDGQTIFLFTGLEDTNDTASILQPVLGWNSDFASAWGIASWNCCVNGTVWEGTPAQVSSGDHLLGYVISSINCKGSTSCSTWYIGIVDETTGKGSSLTTSNYGQSFNWAFGGVLEVYNVVQCGDYPGGVMNFFNLTVSNANFSPINPSWKMNNSYSGLTPQCNYGASFPQQVTLTF